ncbi:drug/metabolite transporter (DMT)-like permease [Microvirga flocculans]|uniref:Drug/metabolite transporter (DMT)-like permease n=2 Tax=Microvirga flocculans TaxID=217168 RepID=A0A7W6N789_9HYPH|nr:drug/metabolite transporter (DMT)-like permease [Microvirga flocculans]
MCLIWGATWIAIKVGVALVPPILFSGTRFVMAGALLLAYRWAAGHPITIQRQDCPRLTVATLFMVTLTYALLFWGALHVSSGLAAVIDLSFLPVALLAFAVALGEEQLHSRRLGALVLGISGLLLLFGPKAFVGQDSSTLELWGGAAIALSALIYAAGSVLARPLLRHYPSTLISGHTLLWGGALTTLAALAFEPGASDALPPRWNASAWASWLFLVLGGSIAAYTIYLKLVRDWGPSRAGAYCFVSPAIAVLLGMIVLNETVTPHEWAGMAIMLAAAWLAIRNAPAFVPERPMSQEME